MNLMPIIISVTCSFVIALVGWQVLFRNAKRLASRSETFTQVTSIMSLLKEVKVSSEGFWLKEENNDSPILYDTYVGLKLREVLDLLKILESRHININNGAKSVSKVRSACTLQSPSVKNISTKVEKAKILRAIYGIISSCENEVYKAYSSQYPPIK